MAAKIVSPALAACREACELPVPSLRAVATDLQTEMRAGLASDGRCLKMLPTFVTQLPSGCVGSSQRVDRTGDVQKPRRAADLTRLCASNSKERGAWYALDLGGTNFRVLRLHLADSDGGVEHVQVSSWARRTTLGR